MEVRKQAA